MKIETVADVKCMVETGHLISSSGEILDLDAAYVVAMVEPELLAQSITELGLVSTLALFPGCGPGYYLHYGKHAGALNFEVSIKYVNREDPIEF